MSRFVKTSIVMEVPVEKIIGAFLSVEHVSQWWGVERALIEPCIGGVYILNWGVTSQGIQYVSSGFISSINTSSHLHIDKYIYLNPSRQILGPQRLIIEVSEENNASRLRLEQGPYPEGVSEDWDWYYEAVDKAWPEVLASLKNYLISG